MKENEKICNTYKNLLAYASLYETPFYNYEQLEKYYLCELLKATPEDIANALQLLAADDIIEEMYDKDSVYMLISIFELWARRDLRCFLG
jgi:hypothetical protein